MGTGGESVFEDGSVLSLSDDVLFVVVEWSGGTTANGTGEKGVVEEGDSMGWRGVAERLSIRGVDKLSRSSSWWLDRPVVWWVWICLEVRILGLLTGSMTLAGGAWIEEEESGFAPTMTVMGRTAGTAGTAGVEIEEGGGEGTAGGELEDWGGLLAAIFMEFDPLEGSWTDCCWEKGTSCLIRGKGAIEGWLNWFNSSDWGSFKSESLSLESGSVSINSSGSMLLSVAGVPCEAMDCELHCDFLKRADFEGLVSIWEVGDVCMPLEGTWGGWNSGFGA